MQGQPVAGLLQTGPLAIDKNQHQVLLHGQLLNLTATQYTLLLYLVEQAGQVVDTETLEQAIWADEYIEDPERLKSAPGAGQRVEPAGECARRRLRLAKLIRLILPLIYPYISPLFLQLA